MEFKPPFKIKIIELSYHNLFFDGSIQFHEKTYKLHIQNEVNQKIIKLPFPILGVKNHNVLVRISGRNGIYVQDHLIFEGSSNSMEIESQIINEDITNKYAVLDTIEIFFR